MRSNRRTYSPQLTGMSQPEYQEHGVECYLSVLEQVPLFYGRYSPLGKSKIAKVTNRATKEVLL